MGFFLFPFLLVGGCGAGGFVLWVFGVSVGYLSFL